LARKRCVPLRYSFAALAVFLRRDIARFARFRTRQISKILDPTRLIRSDAASDHPIKKK